jgi:hypothetical protein
MAISTLSLTLPEQKEATRSQYQRAAVMLAAAWPRLERLAAARGVRLDGGDDFRVLATILARGPGRSTMRQKGERPHVDKRTGEMRPCRRRTRGLADWLGWARGRVWRSITRLSEAGLLWGVLYQQGDLLPTGKPARTNVVRYVVRVGAIVDAYDPHAFAGMEPGSDPEPPDGSGSEPSLGSRRGDSTATPKPPSGRSRGGRAGSVDAASPPEDSHGAPSARESEASETSPEADAKTPAPGGASGAAAERAPREGEHGACPGDVAAVAAAWDRARIPWGTDAPDRVSVCRKNERTMIAARLAELPAAMLLLAVAGAERDRRIREGREVHCSAAYVFSSAQRVRRFAAAGEAAAHERQARELRDRAQTLQQRAYERGEWLGADEARALAERERQAAPANDDGRRGPC